MRAEYSEKVYPNWLLLIEFEIRRIGKFFMVPWLG